ncbi:hypothetical protein ABT336_24585 [Micromonospora sp. NPDC000207]|uniref:hypothetical protein n=1 Tax=Micromonospora sp. NPDC000207 TaxID=3154246 RepID=UPI00331C9A98
MTDPWNTDQLFPELYYDEDDYAAILAPFTGEQNEMMHRVSGEPVNQPQNDRAAYIAALDALPEGQLPRQARKPIAWPHSVYAAALDAFPVGELPKFHQSVEVPGYAVPVPIGIFLSTLRSKGIVGANVGQDLVDALGRHGQVLEPDPADSTRVKLPWTGKHITWPQSVYAAALDLLPVGELPKVHQSVEVPGYAVPVPIGIFFRTLRSKGIVGAGVDPALVDALARRGQVLNPDPDDPTKVKLSASGKHITWPQSVYAAALDLLPAGELPKSCQSVEVPGYAVPVPIGIFLSNLRSRGIVGANVGQVLVDALGRRGLVLVPDPADPTRVKLPLAGTRTEWPHSVYAAALGTFPAGKLPKKREKVKLSGHDVPVPIGTFVSDLRSVGIVGANVGPVLVEALRRHGQRLEPHPTRAGKVRLVRDVDGAATHVVAAMAGPRAPGQEGFAGRDRSGSPGPQSKRARVLDSEQAMAGLGR